MKKRSRANCREKEAAHNGNRYNKCKSRERALAYYSYKWLTGKERERERRDPLYYIDREREG